MGGGECRIPSNAGGFWGVGGARGEIAVGWAGEKGEIAYIAVYGGLHISGGNVV